MTAAARCHSGFTLLEMLITLAIFSVLGLAAHGSLQQVLEANQLSEQRSEALAKVQWAFGQLQRDVEQVSWRPYRQAGEEPIEQALVGGIGVGNSEQAGMSLLRAGWSNPAGLLGRSDLQPVSYYVEQDRLVRAYQVYPDSVSGSEPRQTVLLEKIERFELAFFDGQRWQTQWQQSLPPKALRVRLQSEGWEVLERLFLLPAPVERGGSDETS